MQNAASDRGLTFFAYRNFFPKVIRKKRSTRNPLTQNLLIQVIKMETSTGQKRVKVVIITNLEQKQKSA